MMTRGPSSAGPDRQQVQDALDALFRLDSDDAGELLLVRHAEPAPWPQAGGLPEAPDPMLSCEGLRQAERLADRLCDLGIDAVYTAPERRCLQTARVVADTLRCPLTVSEDLADIEFDAALARGDADAYAARFSRDPHWDALPGFASSRSFRRRAVAGIEALVAAHPGRRCLAVTHSGVINAYLSMLLCIPRDQFFAADHASISTVCHRGGLYGVRGLNDVAHLTLSDRLLTPPRPFTGRSLPLTNR